MNINQLKDAFDMAGQKVQDLEDKRAQIVVDLGKDESSHSVDEVTKLNESLKNAKMNQELAKAAYEDARADLNAVRNHYQLNKTVKLILRLLRTNLFLILRTW
jgi:hypothetical protein